VTKRPHVDRWERVLAWSLRIALVAMALYHAVIGDFVIVGYCVLASAVLLVPPILARTSHANIPVELELVLIVLLAMDLILGKWLGLYDRIVYWDKVLHLGDSAMLGTLGFLCLFVLRTTGRLRVGPAFAVGITVWLTLGLGAAWEIGEFTVDRIFGTYTQGSPTMSPLVDTMWDLILDALGGLAGGIVGVAYLHQSSRARRVSHWFQHVTTP
jgi:hypothetical protein